MKKHSLSQEEKVKYVLNRLCQDVQSRTVTTHISPEVLTWALKRNFLEETLTTFISEGMVFAIKKHDSEVTWCVEKSQSAIKVNYWDSVWLARWICIRIP